jgi:ribonuclease HI
MTRRQVIHADGTFTPETGKGGWAAVILETETGAGEISSSSEAELRAVLEAVKMAEGPCTVVTDSISIVRNVEAGISPQKGHELWRELYAAMAGKDVQVEWRKRSSTHGQRLAHELARKEARGLP